MSIRAKALAWLRPGSGLWPGVLVALLFFGAMFWAKGRDPFRRIWFKVKAPGFGKAECIAVLPKNRPKFQVQSPKSRGAGWPVVVYLHGAGGSLLGSGNELRQMAEMGLAAIGMDYCQTNEAVFEAQFSALLNYLQRQPWADTNRMAWVGFSLGAQRSLTFALRHPDRQPNLLVRLAGGWVPELQSKVQSLKSKVNAQPSQPSTLNSQLSTTVLLLHGENDEVFGLPQARRVAACLETNGTAVELKVLPGEGHGLGPNRLLVFRVIGEQCLTRLKGPDALASYRSILSWQSAAWPLWVFLLPALAWAGAWFWRRRRRTQHDRKPQQEQTEATEKRSLLALFSPLRVCAVLLAALALAQTALHLVPPHLPVSDRTLSIARGVIVPAKELADFNYLAADPMWRGKPLKTLLVHVELAHYNRELVNWRVDERVYRQFVLSPEIGPVVDGGMNWRRPLWENFYPRIRKEQDPQAAAEVVARFLRERVTIASGKGLPSTVAAVWERQVTNERGFEAVYVAALRSVGVPSRLDANGRAEFWNGAEWQAAPRPLIEVWK